MTKTTEKTVTLPLALQVIGMDRNRFNYLYFLGREDDDVGPPLLRTKFPNATPGVARPLTQENCLELAFMHKLLLIGLIIPAAQQVAASWLKSLSKGNRLGVWVRDRASTAGGAFVHESATVSDLMQLFAPQDHLVDEKPVVPWGRAAPDDIQMINVSEIVRRIEALFAEKSE